MFYNVFFNPWHNTPFAFHARATYLLYFASLIFSLSFSSTIYLTRMTAGINNEMDRRDERSICLAYALLNPTMRRTATHREIMESEKDPRIKFYNMRMRSRLHRADPAGQWFMESEKTVLIFQRILENIQCPLDARSIYSTPFFALVDNLDEREHVKWLKKPRNLNRRARIFHRGSCMQDLSFVFVENIYLKSIVHCIRSLWFDFVIHCS